MFVIKIRNIYFVYINVYVIISTIIIIIIIYHYSLVYMNAYIVHVTLHTVKYALNVGLHNL